MNVFRNTSYTQVGQTDVYLSTTEPAHESLSPTREVFEKFLGGKFSNKPKWVFTTMVCGLCAITLGSVIVAVDPYEVIFTKKVTFTPGQEEFEIWEKPAVDLYLKVYLFNVTNRDEYMSGKDSKLKFSQTGPYVYKEIMSHRNATFNPNGTITSIPSHPLVYVPEMSNGSQDEILVLPNICLLSFAHVMKDSSLFTRMGVNVLIKNTNTQPLVEMSAKEFMFGYKSTLLTLGNKFLPSWIKFDKLGLIDRMYDFDGDTSVSFTGKFDKRRAGLLEKYRGLPYLPQWSAPCNNLSLASDGTKFPARLTKDDQPLFFRKSLCRSMPLKLIGEETIGGIHGYKYTFIDNAMDNGAVNPANKCFCKSNPCFPSGILDVKDCYYGFPIVLSYPHFLETDKSVLDAVEGLHPDNEKHRTFFVINEEAGLPLKVSVKMQINMGLGDLSRIANSKKFSNMILPMLWMEIAMPGLTPELNTKFWFYLTAGPIAQAVSTYLLLICGVAFILLSLASAVLIPRMSLISVNRTGPQVSTNSSSKPGDWKRRESHELPVGKKRDPGPPPKSTNSKEMEMYYCSLLAVPNDDS